MKKSLVIVLGMICAINLLACAGEMAEPVTVADGMLAEEEIEAIFGTLHRERKKEEIPASKKQDIEAVAQAEVAEATEPEGETETIATEKKDVSVDGVPVQYSHLFETGYFDENLVWTGYNDEYAELIEEMYTFCEENAVGSVMLATDDNVLFAGGFNAKEIDGETRVNSFTTYEIESLTQSFTAAAIIQQMQAGNLKGSDTLDQFFPEYPHGKEISVDNLLHMDSGIPDYVNESMKFFAGRTAEGYEAFMNGQMSDEEIISFLNKSELTFEPGKKSRYSATNYYLLALILEQVTGLSYEEYMQTYIFDVCGMESTTCTETGNITAGLKAGEGYLTLGRVCRGAADMHSNVCDILMFNRELMDGRLIDEDHLEYMTEARNEYACGWNVMGEDCIGQYGYTNAYISFNVIFRNEEENLYLIMMIPDGKMWGMPGMVMDVVVGHLE